MRKETKAPESLSAPALADLFADHQESQTRPPGLRPARPPVGLNAEADLTRPVVLREQEPFEALFDVAGQRLISPAEARVTVVGLVTHLGDPTGEQETETERACLQQHVAAEQRRLVVEVPVDDARVRKLIPDDRPLRPRERPVRQRWPRRLRAQRLL